MLAGSFHFFFFFSVLQRFSPPWLGGTGLQVAQLIWRAQLAHPGSCHIYICMMLSCARAKCKWIRSALDARAGGRSVFSLLRELPGAFRLTPTLLAPWDWSIGSC
jgi:hypothetical protein